MSNLLPACPSIEPEGILDFRERRMRHSILPEYLVKWNDMPEEGLTWESIEVLWSSGTKQLPPLHPLLVKGRNLYRLETYRQPWMNEAERKVALDEKHTRGGVARAMRAASKAGSLRPALKPLTNRNGNVSSNFSQILNGKAAEQTQGVRGNFNHILNGKAAEQTQGVSSNFNHILNGKVAEQTQGVLEPGPHHLCGKAAGLLPVPANYKFATKITCTSCHNPGARNCISRLCYYCCRRTAKFCERHSDMQLASIHVSLR